MNLNPVTGQIQNFFTIDIMNPQPKTAFRTLQALYHEEHNAEDGNAYYYVSFQMAIDTAREVHVLKFAAADLSIQWHFAREGSGSNSLPTA